MFTFDVREIPFACRGSWFNLSPVIGPHERAAHVHLVSHQTGLHPILELVPLRAGAPVEASVVATESMLRWSASGGSVEAAFEAPDVLRVRGSGLGMRFGAVRRALTPFSGTYLIADPVDGAVLMTSYETGRRYRITILAGKPALAGDGALGVADRGVTFGDQPWQIAIEEFEAARARYRETRDFDDVVRRSSADFADYRAAVAPAGSRAADKAAYVMWSATVRPAGFFAREAVLMSKHWMDKVWSWDHCFNALALAASDPAAAVDQLLLPFDHQEASGALPDSIAHSEILYNFVKPPIHGWALRKLRERARAPLALDDLRGVYDGLARWTQFWLSSRRAPGRVLPYYQHGNDSGWDNSTTFDHDRIVEGPDLAAFLVVQLDVLTELAAELGIAATPWSAHARQVERALVSELWDGAHFVARSVATGKPSSTTSLMNALPIVLGDRLDPAIAARLAATIQEHLTEWGPATELVSSAHYVSDGYWRGPIWAPSTFLIEDGVRRAGFSDLADTIAARFRALCERSGFAENFDAITGEGLRDRAYTWTASAYLLLLADHAAREPV